MTDKFIPVFARETSNPNGATTAPALPRAADAYGISLMLFPAAAPQAVFKVTGRTVERRRVGTGTAA